MSYEIKPGLIASAGIIIDKEEKVTVVGELKFPPYELFGKYPKPSKRIPISRPSRRTSPSPTSPSARSGSRHRSGLASSWSTASGLA